VPSSLGLTGLLGAVIVVGVATIVPPPPSSVVPVAVAVAVPASLPNPSGTISVYIGGRSITSSW
jgi:hypothetical protein